MCAIGASPYGGAMTSAQPIAPINYPQLPDSGIVDDFHGVSVPDPYRYLEDPQDARTTEWLQEQELLMDAERETWTSRAHYVDRVGELLGSGAISPPYIRGSRTFFTKREPGQQFAVLYVRDTGDSHTDPQTARVLIDPMAMDPEGHTTLDSWQPSKEGDLLAYQISQGGNEESDVYVMNVETGETVEGPIGRCRYSPIAWLKGGSAFYYVRRIAPELLPESERHFHRRVYLHTVGADPQTDVLVFGAGMNMTNYYGVSVSRDGRWLEVSSSEGTEPRNDLWIADLTASEPSSPSFELVQGDVDAQTSVTFGRDGRAYIFTDRDAPRGTVLVTTPGSWNPDSWTTLIPEPQDSVLESVTLLDGEGLDHDQLLVVHTSHGVAHMAMHAAADGATLYEIELPGAGTIGGPVEHIDGGPITWIVYTDHTTVPTVYEFDARTRQLTLYANPPGAVTAPEVHSELITYPSLDGTTVRMFVISPTGTPDQPRPTILYGYGGFGIPLQPGYSAAILAWVESGGVWAIANLRGGGEEGEEWHRAGMLANKQNVFDDFHAAAEYLISQGWTTSEQLGIYGGSNGGLLVGAAMTQRPELFNAVVCVAPLLDMIRYVESELGPTWTVEYGDPADAEQFGWLHAYSPYHRVTNGTDYPATMFAIFDNDTRTDPMHGRKMAAAVQANTAGARPILVRTEKNVGHGARSLNKSIEETADTLAFMSRWTGLDR
jgi:prolyl oligopeptidase